MGQEKEWVLSLGGVDAVAVVIVGLVFLFLIWKSLKKLVLLQ
jgi:hypothetical protein